MVDAGLEPTYAEKNESMAVGLGLPIFWRGKRGSSVVRHLPLVLEVPGSIPARGEKNFGVRTRFL